MADRGGNTPIDDLEEWLNRMEVEAEDLGIAGDDLKWRSFVYDKLTELHAQIGVPTSDQSFFNRFDALVNIGKDIRQEIGFIRTSALDKWGRQFFQWRDLAGRYISEEVAKSSFELWQTVHFTLP